MLWFLILSNCWFKHVCTTSESPDDLIVYVLVQLVSEKALLHQRGIFVEDPNCNSEITLLLLQSVCMFKVYTQEPHWRRQVGSPPLLLKQRHTVLTGASALLASWQLCTHRRALVPTSSTAWQGGSSTRIRWIFMCTFKWNFAYRCEEATVRLCRVLRDKWHITETYMYLKSKWTKPLGIGKSEMKSQYRISTRWHPGMASQSDTILAYNYSRCHSGMASVLLLNFKFF